MKVRGPDGKVISFPDDTPPDTIKAVMARQYGGPSAIAPPMAMTPQSNPMASMGADLRGRALGALPAAGGFIGGLLGAGTPARIPLAAAGGALGEGASEAIQGRPLDFGAIGASGVKQGAYEAAGGLLAKGAGMAARPLMRGAVGAGRSIQKGFGDVTETMLNRGLAVSGGGLAKATRLRNASSEALQNLLQKAEASGRTLSAMEVTRHVRAISSDRAMPLAEKNKVMGQLTDFLKEQPGRISPTLLKEIKQFYQMRSSYKDVPQAEMANKLFSKTLAQGAREQLETIPGVAAMEAETRSLIGAERALKDATMRRPPPFDLSRPGTYPVVSSTVGSPYAQGQLARTFASRKFQAFLRQNPRAAAELIQQLIHTDEPDALR